MSDSVASTTPPLVWIIGSGGLLGGAIAHEFPNSFQSTKIRWEKSGDSVKDLTANLEAFHDTAIENQEWIIIWAAGHATVTSSQEECNQELAVFESFVRLVSQQLTSHGRFFLASSAGGVYAASANPPFNAGSPTSPASPYGYLKLAQEHVVDSGFTNEKVVTTIAGRFSNLYGPGQDLTKLQGLVSRLVLAGLTKQIMSIFVPLDTLRDFIYVSDAAEVVRVILEMQDPPSIVVIASGEPKSLGAVVTQVKDVLRVNIPISYGEHASSSGQSPDLRLQPTIACINLTPFPAGIKSVILDLTGRIQNHETKDHGGSASSL